MFFYCVEEEIKEIKKQLNDSFDVESRIIVKNNQKIGLIYLKSMTDGKVFSESIYKVINEFDGELTNENLLNKVIISNDVAEINKEEVVQKILDGCVIVLTGLSEKFVSSEIQKYPQRTPSEPPTTPVINGPREGFTEDIKTNITLLRRRFYSKDLVLTNLSVGRYTKTKIVVAYINGIADKRIVRKIISRLKRIDVDGIIDSYYILECLQERPHSLFKQVGFNEKPDVISAKMLEGRVAIIVDNSPIVLTLPFVIIEDIQNSNDYYANHYYAGYLRIIRIIGLLMAVFGPGLFLSLRLYHYYILPLKYLITISDTTQNIPFTPFIEILFVSLLFQILYEVSLRLPSYLGLATSVVGALILGDTGVKAGLISPPTVIIVALAKIAQYTVPEQNYQITILQFLFLILGGALGIFSIVGGMIYLVQYLTTIDSYTAPYLAPFSPKVDSDLNDAIFKTSFTNMKQRPQSFSNVNKDRME